nr:MAG TPA: hypothetical protein [Caudoviricetes sp.]
MFLLYPYRRYLSSRWPLAGGFSIIHIRDLNLT